MTTLKIGDPVTVCLGWVAIAHGHVEDDDGAYVVNGDRFTGWPACFVECGVRQLATGHQPLDRVVNVGLAVSVPADLFYERDPCPKCGAFRLTRGYGLGFGPGIGTYEVCDVDGCGHRTFDADTFDDEPATL